MVDQDILLAKVDVIKRCLERIRTVTGNNPDRLDNIDVQDIFVLNLQRAVQAAIDLAVHIIADEEYGLPDSLGANFQLLYEHKHITKDIVVKMKAMVGFRNIAVHDYQRIDLAILKSIMKNNLSDIEDYYRALIRSDKGQVIRDK